MNKFSTVKCVYSNWKIIILENNTIIEEELRKNTLTYLREWEIRRYQNIAGNREMCG